jgi:hypothetical protein
VDVNSRTLNGCRIMVFMEKPQSLKLKIGEPIPEHVLAALKAAKPIEVPAPQPPPLPNPASMPKPDEHAQESILSKIFKAKPCIYCEKPVSFFSSKHEECEASAFRARDAISKQIRSYLECGDASYGGKASIDVLAAGARLSNDESKNAVKQGFHSAVSNILNQRVISAEEEARLSALIYDWGFHQSDLNRNGSWTKVVQSFVIRDLLEGKTPNRCTIANSTLLLGKNESYIWIFNRVDVYERKTHRSYEGRHAGFSVRIAKGIYLREGAYRGHAVEHVSTDHVGSGDFVVTNKNLFIVVGGHTTKLSLKKIVSVTPHSDGISFQCDGARAPQYSIRHLDPWFAYNVLMNLSALVD